MDIYMYFSSGQEVQLVGIQELQVGMRRYAWWIMSYYVHWLDLSVLFF